MDKERTDRRQRRSFTDEFKAGAVALVLDQGKPIAQVARDLDLTASALSSWVEQARAIPASASPFHPRPPDPVLHPSNSPHPTTADLPVAPGGPA